MMLKIASLSKWLPTEATFKWLLTRMGHHVMFEVPLLWKTPSTFLAGVGSFACVTTLVATHTGYLCKNFATISARICLCFCVSLLLVAFHLVIKREDCPTCITVKLPTKGKSSWCSRRGCWGWCILLHGKHACWFCKYNVLVESVNIFVLKLFLLLVKKKIIENLWLFFKLTYLYF